MDKNNHVTPRYAIFDMDGLMFDTERLLIQAFQTQVSKTAGCSFPTSQMTAMLGLNYQACEQVFEATFDCRLPFSECCKIADAWVDQYINVHGVPVKPGLFSLLDWLKKHQFRMAVATGSDTGTARFYIQEADASSYFDAVIGGELVSRGKPDPQIFQIAARSLGCTNPTECIVFEDSENGLLAAAAAEMKAVIVPDLMDPTAGREGMYLARVSSLSDAIPVLEKLCR